MPEEKETLAAEVELEEISQCERRIRFSVPLEEVEREFHAAYEEVRDTAQIPGFRPGKAPRHIVEMRMGKAFREAALSRIRERALAQAVLDHNLRLVSSPQFDKVAYEKGKAFTFEATMEVIPSITLPEYKGIKIERRDALPTTEADVMEELGRIRRSFTELGPVENRPLRDGDLAVVTYEEELDGKTKKFERELVEIKEGLLFPGFVEKLRGMRPGEKREFQIRVADDYSDKGAAGKVVNYRVHLEEVRTKVVPQAGDDFAKKIGFESLESLRKHLHTTITERRERDAEEEEVSQVMGYLLRNSDFDVPKSLLVEETRRRMRREIDAAFRRGLSAQQVREKREELFKDAAGEAYTELKAQIIVLKVAEAEGIEVSSEEMAARIDAIASAAKIDIDVVRKRYRDEQRLDDLKYQILEQKVISFLHNSAVKE